jgi:3-ketosteroid 9alpha-monooxygenase subunit A
MAAVQIPLPQTAKVQIPVAPIRERLYDVRHAIGWYCVADSSEVTADAMLPVHYLDRQLIVYRSPGGEARVSDAYCPHLGAHLASHTGCIRNGRIVCPFHKWEFDTDSGRVASIPYTKVTPPVSLETYPTREVNGMVMMWYHPEGAAPTFPPFEANEFGNDKYDLFMRRRWETTGPFRDNLENLFDTAHIITLHNAASIPEMGRIEETKYGMRIEYEPGEQEMALEKFVFHFGGLSHLVQHFHGRGWDVVNVLSFTPVDLERWVIDGRIFVRDTGSKEMNAQLGTPFAERFIYEVEQDLPIFHHKKHLKEPKLCAGDGPIMRFREYCRQFFPPLS